MPRMCAACGTKAKGCCATSRFHSWEVADHKPSSYFGSTVIGSPAKFTTFSLFAGAFDVAGAPFPPAAWFRLVRSGLPFRH
jgi:hypothetical protein